MKKVIPGVLALVAVAVTATFVLVKKSTSHHTRGTELAPSETLFFVHFPDLKRTSERWPKTALAQIGEEPEVKAFLAKPRAELPQMKLWEQKKTQLARIEPGEAFLAVTSIDGPSPRFVAGLSFAGRKADVEALLSEARIDLKRAWPAGKSDVTSQGKTQIETFTYQDTTVGEAFCEDWYFVSNDLALLRHTIDATPKGMAGNALSENALFQKSTAQLPRDNEGVVFAQLGILSERLVSLLVAGGQTLDAKQVADLKKVQALAWGTKFEGEQMRDTLFLLSPGTAIEPPLARNVLAFTSAATFLTYASALPQTFEMPESSLALGAFVPGFSAMEKGLADKGLKWGDFTKAFGPEMGLVGNWAEKSGQPSVLLSLDVRDAATAKAFVDVVTGGLPGSPPWGRKEENGTTIYQSPGTGGLISLSPAAALTDKFLVIGLSQPEIAGALEQLRSGSSAVAVNPGFRNSAQAVGTPTAGFAYVDLKALFERSYATLRPLLAMSLAFSPDAGQYIDAGKLPSTETISKHLGPSIYSQSATPDGTVIESVGTLTLNQVLLGAVGGATAAAFPMIENALASGFKWDPSTFQAPPPAAKPTPEGRSENQKADPGVPPPPSNSENKPAAPAGSASTVPQL